MMKKIILLLVLLFLPLLIVELSLRNPAVFLKLLSFTSPTEWSKGYIKVNYWPEILVMGSSLTRSSIDPDLLEEVVGKKGFRYQVGDISVPSDSLANDFFTLNRIFATCVKCPEKIILGLTDIALKEHELAGWQPITKARIKQNYIFDTDDLLSQAAILDPSYAEHKREIDREKFSRLYFYRRDINRMMKNVLFISPQNQTGAIVKTQTTGDPGYGFWAYEQKLSEADPKDSIRNYREYLGNYSIGGSGDFFLRKIIQMSKQRNVELILVSTPLSDIYQTNFVDEVTEYKSYAIKISADHQLRYVNGVDLFPAKHELYSDTNHLNMYGAKLFTKYLGETLISFWTGQKK